MRRYHGWFKDRGTVSREIEWEIGIAGLESEAEGGDDVEGTGKSE